MSEEPPVAEPKITPPAQSELFQLWVRSSGWLVMCMGAVEILGAMHFHSRGELPLPFLVGVILMGASVILAGQGISEGYAWGIPIIPLMIGLNLPGFLVGYLIYKLSKPAIDSGVLRMDLSPNARTAYGLWIGGFTCLMLGFIFS